ncbi:hypothetical protein AVEN_211093-1 [Araneus ventricosus]|uniref:Uncharacterized protein n=1 Tax=Araneus ventricosus TaxID=182803 RepID=A0A4Y2GW59_ARAVE|nr:hypothetical protein AVEN_211093-1 [Araneus ventricosus]
MKVVDTKIFSSETWEKNENCFGIVDNWFLPRSRLCFVTSLVCFSFFHTRSFRYPLKAPSLQQLQEGERNLLISSPVYPELSSCIELWHVYTYNLSEMKSFHRRYHSTKKMTGNPLTSQVF